MELQGFENKARPIGVLGVKISQGGEVIALVENKVEGNPEGEQPHLHFELWHQGTPINPEKYIVF